MVGILTAFFSNAEPKIQFNIEPVFSVGPSTIRPDMVLKLGNEDIILEVIQSRIYPEHEFLEHDLHTTQLKKLMKVTKKKYGILYYLPLKKDDQIMISRISTLNIRSVYPMDKGTYEMLEHDAEIYGNE